MVVAVAELHDMGGAIAGRKLDEAQAVAVGVETHGLGIDGDAVAPGQTVGQITVVQVDGHGLGLRGRSGPPAG